MNRFKPLYYLLGAMIMVALLLPSLALAVDPPQHTLALPTTQIWCIVAGCISPLITYVLNNRLLKNLSEPIKAVIFLVGAAIAGGIAQAINAGNVGFNQSTFQLVATSVLAAIIAHFGFWQPSTIAAKVRG